MNRKRADGVSAKSSVSVTLIEATVALLQVHEKGIDEEQLLSGMPLIADDLTQDQMIRAVARLGFVAAWNELIDLDSVNTPCCMLRCSGGHLLVLKVSRDIVRVADPNIPNAYREVPRQDFEIHEFTGWFEVLPSADLLLDEFSNQSHREHWFWSKLYVDKNRLLDVVLSSVFANILAVMVSLFGLQVYDRVIPGQSESTLWVLAGGVLLAIGFEGALRVARAMLIDRLGKDSEVKISGELFSKILGMKLQKQPISAGGIAHSMREFSAVKEFFSTAAFGVVADLPFVFLFLGLIYGIAGNVVWVVATGALFIVVPSMLLQSKMARISEEGMGRIASSSRILTEATYGLESIRVSRFESQFQKKWEDITALNVGVTTKQRNLSAFLVFWSAAMQQCTYVFAVIACVYMVFAGEFTIGSIIAVSILSTRTLSPISQLSQVIAKWQNMKTALFSLDAIINSDQVRDEKKMYIRRKGFQGRLTAQRLKFSHLSSKRYEIDIDKMEVAPGTRLAILGASGSGKSTLLRVLAGLYDPTEGNIQLDGLDLRQIDPLDLRRNIGYLPQEIRMFRGTLRDNLSSATKNKHDTELLEALKFSGLSNFVQRHPEGLDLKITDGGGGLSIGQRQSIGLARLYLQDPDIILMDEPTASLDQATEDHVVKQIGDWIGRRTCLVATHRMKILSEVSHVVVLKDGRVTKFGKREDVVSKSKATFNKADKASSVF